MPSAMLELLGDFDDVEVEEVAQDDRLTLTPGELRHRTMHRGDLGDLGGSDRLAALGESQQRTVFPATPTEH